MARRADPPRRARRRRPEAEEEHEGGMERWLVTYADMLTLLFVLFVVLFAMSKIDALKYQELKQGLSAGFGTATSLLTGEHSILPGNEANSQGISAMDASIGTPIQPTNESINSQAVANAVQQAMTQAAQRTDAQAQAQVRNLLAAWQKIRDRLKEKGYASDVRAGIDDRGLVISLTSRHVTFTSDLATLTPRGAQIVDTIAPVLKALDTPLEIDGNTNQTGSPKYYHTGWDLAAARAITVLLRLEDMHGLPKDSLRATSFGSTKPLIDSLSPRAQNINKRVDIVVLSQAPAETRADYQQAYTEITGKKNASDIGNPGVDTSDADSGSSATTGLSPAASGVLSSLNDSSSSNSGGTP